MPRVFAFDPHHDGSPLYCQPLDAAGRPLVDSPVPLGGQLLLRVRVPDDHNGRPGAERVVLRSVRDGEPFIQVAQEAAGYPGGRWWEVRLRLVNPLTSYRFLVVSHRHPYRWLNAEGLHARDVTDAADFKFSTEHLLPGWVPDQIGYQIFPDRFARTETGVPLPAWARHAEWQEPVIHKGPLVPGQVYGGTLAGITQHLDYIRDFGATLIYLTPFFAARSNHRYDSISFDRVDPLLGGDEALQELLESAHRDGLRVVGDLTTNHTGDAHDWFVSAQRDPDSVERGFYRFRDDGTYAAWLDIESLPKLDHGNAELATRLYAGPDSVVARWLRAGLDGWRIDVANMTGRLGADDHAQRVAQSLRQTIAQVNPEGWLLAEHGHDASLDLAGSGWHGTMDYAGFTRPIWAWLNGGSDEGPGLPHGLDWLGLPIGIPVISGEAAVDTMREVHAAMPWASYCSSTMHLDSHDTPRFRTVTGGGTDGWIDADGVGRDRHLVGLGLQFTLPGMPVVFAGDELGLTAVDGEHARTPFPWDREAEWDAVTHHAYRHWISLRTHNVALRRGSLRWVAASEDSMTFLREHPEQTLLVHAARGSAPAVEIDLANLNGVLTDDAGECLSATGLVNIGFVDGVVRCVATGPGVAVFALNGQ